MKPPAYSVHAGGKRRQSAERVVKSLIFAGRFLPRKVARHSALDDRVPSVAFIIEGLLRIKNGPKHFVRVIVDERESGAGAGKLIIGLIVKKHGVSM